MHPSLTLLPLFLAAVQSKAIPFQTVTVLPIKGVPDVTAGNGFNSIANSLLNNAESVSLQTKAIDSENAKLSASGSAGLPAVDIAKHLQNITNTFWQTTADVEKKVCSFALSVNKQNVGAQQKNLVAGINAQANVIVNLAFAIGATIDKSQDKLTTFTKSESTILAAAIAAAVTSAKASVVPVTTLVNGLKAVGHGGFTDSISSVQASLDVLAKTAARVNFG